ncbi:hypothetical protein G5I_01331 [Acromyrmex echinatior]|uniref:Uncharacterized protein n=1 Tax=Acromyrmex echinatior TaxID=103372 RepID=F4W7B6_ACREC|nr:hypothetical protein G5I_01331 [Acromyrmex echinatior]
MADKMGYANGKHNEGERKRVDRKSDEGGKSRAHRVAMSTVCDTGCSRQKITERPVEALTARGWHCSRCRRTSRIAFVQHGEDTRQFSWTSALAETDKTHKKNNRYKETKQKNYEHYFEMRNLENVFNLREADLWYQANRTKLGLNSRQGRLLQYARIRKRTERRGNGADKVKSTAKSRQAAPEIPKYRTRGITSVAGRCHPFRKREVKEGKKESEHKIGLSQWSPARLRPLSGAFIVGLAFNEQAERQIKAAIISRNPRLAGYPGAGVI